MNWSYLTAGSNAGSMIKIQEGFKFEPAAGC